VASLHLRIIADRWGTPLEPCDARTFDAQALAPGTCGEIVVSGAHVLDSYLDGVGDDETKIRAGDTVWHRTGDAGYVDAAGRLWLLGRCSARVSDARGTLYPLAVEAAASEVAGVRRSAFTACRGRRVLVVETDPAAATPETVEALLRRELRWAVLDDVVVVGRIPVDARHNAKVDYPALNRLLRRVRISAPATWRITGSFPLPTAPARAWRRYARRSPAPVRR
jgi:acyl-CoA synthetase (AMP-forming)/AMP-acid ligase II